MNTRPLVTAATVVTGVTLIISLLTAYGVPMTEEQREIWLQIAAYAAPWAVVWWGQSRMTSLNNPKDTDGVELTRPGDVPANNKLATLQAEAIKINTGGGIR